ncbi:MAG: M16 family metallopeptidase [Minisyncoccia bacterium]
MKLPKILKLSSGIKTIIYPSDFLPLTTILILVKTGTDYENRNNNGISHFIEHLFFKGTKNYPDPNILAVELDKIGADYNAFTSYEYTGYYIKTLPEFTEKGIELLGDMLMNPIFDEKEIEKERGVILEEIKFVHDTPQYYIFDIGLKLLYGDQPAGWPILGKESIIKRLKRKDILDYFLRQYTNNNMLIIVVGKFNKDKILKKLEKTFSKFKRLKPYKKAITKNYQDKLKTKIIQRKDIKQAHVLILFRTKGLKELKEERFKEKLLTSILGYGFSSRLFKILRQELGLTYYLKIDDTFFYDRGYFYIQFGCDIDKIELALSKTTQELKDIKKEKIYDDEIEKSKIILKNNLLSTVETSMDLASFYGFEYFYFNKFLSIEENIRKIEKIGEKDLKETANKILNIKNLNCVIISPFLDKKIDIRKALKSLV